MENIAVAAGAVKYFGRILEYPNGCVDILASNRPIFGPKGWEESQKWDEPGKQDSQEERIPARFFIGPPRPPVPESVDRAHRRARAQLRRLALCNDFRWFVTLTIDPEKIDSYDTAAVMRRVSQWCSNQVKRRGLRYVLVPERHKSGRVHFHGFFSDCLEAVDSGHKDAAGHTVYNLPGWGYGFTTAIELYGNYSAAVGYVCKYIGKDSEKIGGRWYYSGGDLAKPVEKFVDISASDLREAYPDCWSMSVPGGFFAGVNGVRGETVEG